MARPLIVLAGCDDAVYLVEIGPTGEEDQLAARQPGAAIERARRLDLVPPWASERLVDVDAVGSTLVLALDRRPPLMVSHDAGRTWREAGAGLPRGRAVAVAVDDPDLVLYAARNRLYLSTDGGRFWRALTVELPEIQRIELE